MINGRLYKYISETTEKVFNEDGSEQVGRIVKDDLALCLNKEEYNPNFVFCRYKLLLSDGTIGWFHYYNWEWETVTTETL